MINERQWFFIFLGVVLPGASAIDKGIRVNDPYWIAVGIVWIIGLSAIIYVRHR